MAFDAHVTVGGGHFDPSTGYQAYDNHVAVGAGHGGAPNTYHPNAVDHTITAVYRNNVPSVSILRVSNDDSQAWLDRHQEHVDKSWSMTKDLAKELGLAFGSSKAGDIPGVYEHGVNAAVKSAELFAENMKESWNSFQDWFAKPDRDK